MNSILQKILAYVLKNAGRNEKIYPQQVQRVLLLAAGGIGDSIMILPMIRSLQELMPHSEIHIVVNRRNRVIFQEEKDIFLHELPEKMWQWLAFRRYRFDVVFVLNWIHISSWGLRANLATLRSAWRVISFQGQKYQHFFTHQSHLAAEFANVTDRYLALVGDVFQQADLIVQRNEYTYDIHLPIAVIERVQKNVSLLHAKEKQFAVVNYSAIHPRKEWSYVGFRMCVQLLLRYFPHIVIIAMKHDIQNAESLSKEFSSSSVSVYPETADFLEIACVVQKSQFVFTVDTSIVHVCSASKVPVFAMYIGEKNNHREWSARGVVHGEICTQNGADIHTLTPNEVAHALDTFLSDVGFKTSV